MRENKKQKLLVTSEGKKHAEENSSAYSEREQTDY